VLQPEKVDKTIYFEQTCRKPGIKHIRTKIKHSQTNGNVRIYHWLYDKEFYNKYKFLSFTKEENYDDMSSQTTKEIKEVAEEEIRCLKCRDLLSISIGNHLM